MLFNVVLLKAGIIEERDSITRAVKTANAKKSIHRPRDVREQEKRGSLRDKVRCARDKIHPPSAPETGAEG